MVEKITKHEYVCEICGQAYPDKEDADKCEKKGPPDFEFQVGDRVIVNKENSVDAGEVIERIVVNRSHKSRYKINIEGTGKTINIGEDFLIVFNEETLEELRKNENTDKKETSFVFPEEIPFLHI